MDRRILLLSAPLPAAPVRHIGAAYVVQIAQAVEVPYERFTFFGRGDGSTARSYTALAANSSLSNSPIGRPSVPYDFQPSAQDNKKPIGRSSEMTYWSLASAIAVKSVVREKGRRPFKHGWSIGTLIRIKSETRRIAVNIAKLPEAVA